MDRERLRAAHKPVKERYRREPEAALITLRADGRLDEQEVACSVTTGRALFKAGPDPATGRNGRVAWQSRCSEARE
jgi:hypothetical protein